MNNQAKTLETDTLSQIEADELAEANAMRIAEYRLTKDRYLVLCRRYGLNPFDLDILDHRLDQLPRRDKVQVVRLILRLVRIERSLRDVIGERLLFPLTIVQSERTGYLVPLPLAAGVR